MAHWTKVTSGFDADDETVNFGARTVAEHAGSIYETWTRATIQPEDENVTHNPIINAGFSHSMLCIAIDKSITVFSDESCQEIVSSIGFESLVTAYCLSSNGELLFGAIENGIIHCFNLSVGAQQVFCLDLTEKIGCTNVIQMTLHESDDASDLIVVTSMGKIIKISIPENCDENHDQDMNIVILSSISKISAAAEVINGSNRSSIITLGQEIFIWPNKLIRSAGFRYKKAQFFHDYGGIICLRNDGTLSIVCMRTLLEKVIWRGPVHDFVTVKEKSEERGLMVLMKPEDSKEVTSLHLMSFPDFQVKFSMNVPRNCYLVELSGSVDHLIYLEGTKNTAGLVDTIRIKAIEESMPEFRLQRLLKRHKFDEAREFAKKFQLKVESVFHAEAVVLMERLGPTVHGNDDMNVEEFIGTLEKIRDIRFVYECCKNAMTRDFRDTRRLIVYARQRIVDFMNSSGYLKEDVNDALSVLLAGVSESLRKLETFEIIHTQNSEEENIDEWNRFSRANLLEECIKYLSEAELDAAALIWIRHTSTISPSVTPETVHTILNSIPEALDPQKLWPWLRHFIPSVTSFLPGSLSEIIQWGYKKTKSLETYHRDTWPDIGLTFANSLIEMLQFEEYNVCYQFHQQYANKNSHLQRLMILIQTMSDLSELKCRYKVSLPLSTYMSDPTEVIHLLLNKIHVDGISNLVENFLQQFMLNHSLKNDQVLSSYVQKTLKRSKGWWIWEKAPWDKRLSAVISWIQNVQNRLQQTLEVLKKAPVPWSDAVSALAEKSYRYDHPLVAKIKVEANSVAVKLILKKYNFAHVGTCSNLFNRIIKDNRSTAVDDLLELTKKDAMTRMSVFAMCVNHHLRAGAIDTAVDVIDRLEKEVGIFCCNQVIDVLALKLKNPRQFGGESLQHYVEMLGYIERKLENSESQEAQMIPHLRSIYRLKKEFNLHISLTDFFEKKEEILVNYIVSLIETEEIDAQILRKIERLTDYLGLPRLLGVKKFFESTKNSEILKSYVIEHLQNWVIMSEDECHYANEICCNLVQDVENNSALSLALKRVTARNLANASITEIESVLKCWGQVCAFDGAVSRTNEQIERASIHRIYKDASISAGDVLVPYLTDLFAIASFYENDSRSETHSDDDITLLMKNLSMRTRLLMNEHYDFAVMMILSTISRSMTEILPNYEKEVMEVRKIFNTSVSIMLKKVVNAIVFDMQLGLACLFMLKEDNAVRLLEACGEAYASDQRKDRTIKELNYEYYRLTKNWKKAEEFKSLKLLHHWAKRLGHCGISYKEVLTSSIEDRRNILRRIMMAKRPDTVDTLRDFCAQFGFIFGDCCLSYLEILLSTWQPEFTVEGQGIVINEAQVDELTTECRRVAAEITDKVAMKEYLVKALKVPLLNFYYYEVYLIALELWENDSIDWISNLMFLKSYTRIAGPSEIETDTWLNWSQEGQLPAIARWRLPFLPQVDFFKLITPELNLKTYEKWLRIAQQLSISIPSICTLSVRNSAIEAWKNCDMSTATWSINSLNSTLLKDIKKCLSYMNDIDRLHYGTASLYYVVNHTPPGADLVAAAKECFLYMEEWKKLQGDAADPANKFPRIKEKYLHNTTKHILHTNGLGLPKYLKLVNSPEELIIELYSDESIPLRYKSATRNRPDINAVVNKLGELLPIDLEKARRDLLNEWLQPDTSDTKNDSITAVFRDETSSDSFTTDDNLLRACYIVGSGDKEVFINYLSHVGFDVKEDYNPGVRFRALRVIQSLTDDETLEYYTKINAKQFNQHMKSLQYLTELQRIGIGYSVNGFDSCSKSKLINVLVNSQYGTAKALELIPQIFMDFQLDDYDVLNQTLERMVKLSLVKELKKTLMMVGSLDRLVSCPGYISAWQVVVSEAFNRLDSRDSSDAVDACVDALRLLHSCPVVDKVEFREIIATCWRTGQAHFAAALLPFLGDYDKKEVIERITRDKGIDRVLETLEEMDRKGVLIVKQSVMMLMRKKSEISNGSSEN